MRLTAKEARHLLSGSRNVKNASQICGASYNPAELLLKQTVESLARSQGLGAKTEFQPIAGRRFRLDVAIPDLKLGFECDGWQYHAKHKDAWLKEKKRDRIFLAHGWRVFRFAASEVLSGNAEREIKEILSRDT